MKLSLALIVAAFAEDGEVADDVCRSNGQDVPCDGPAPMNPRSGAGRPDDDNRQQRRYVDLKDMAVKLWAKNGLKGKKNKFDEKKYWTYGCHCILLGDRPMTEMGKGQPTDELDNACKAYKDCQKCVREKHGEMCIGEFVSYTWKWSSKIQGLKGKNAAGSCERELYECDAQFVNDLLNTRDAYKQENHMFWGGFDNNDPDSCPTGGSTPVQHECCGGHDRNYHWIGLNKKKCCADGDSGIVKDISENC